MDSLSLFSFYHSQPTFDSTFDIDWYLAPYLEHRVTRIRTLIWMVQRLNIKCTFRFDVYKLVFLAISLLEFMRKIQRNSKSRVVAGSQSFLPNPD